MKEDWVGLLKLMELQAGINKFYARCSIAESSGSAPEVHPQPQHRSRVKQTLSGSFVYSSKEKER